MRGKADGSQVSQTFPGRRAMVNRAVSEERDQKPPIFPLFPSVTPSSTKGNSECDRKEQE